MTHNLSIGVSQNDSVIMQIVWGVGENWHALQFVLKTITFTNLHNWKKGTRISQY